MIKTGSIKITFIIVILLLQVSCNTILVNEQLPYISIEKITNVDQNSASCFGKVVSDNGLTVMERGICWSSNPLPTTENDTVVVGSGVGSFTGALQNLMPGHTYYVRAYATNENGTAYSDAIQLTTEYDPAVPNPVFNENTCFCTVEDIDGNSYRATKIGNQYWMVENLRVTRYRNGDSIPTIKDNEAWNMLKSGGQGIYNNNSETNSVKKFGRFYNYFAITDARSIAPEGWHVPTNADWLELENYLDSIMTTSDTKAKSLASASDWTASSVAGSVGYLDQISNSLSNNSSGFSALPGGIRSYCGCFAYATTFAAWWSSDQLDDKEAWFRSLNYNSSAFGQGHYEKRFGLSVRCVKDKDTN